MVPAFTAVSFYLDHFGFRDEDEDFLNGEVHLWFTGIPAHGFG